MTGTIKEGVDANVYAEPDTNSIILYRIPSGTRVEADFRQDLGKFCIVCTAIGVQGFCMKKHIKVER